MSLKIGLSSLIILLFLAGVIIIQPVSAGSQLQVVYQTPTALPDGRVIYVVQANDTCGRIELLTKVKVQDLITNNKLDQNCTLAIGKELILTIIVPTPSPTPNPLYTSTPLLPTPTQIKGTGLVCVELYNDVNGNGFQEDTESLMAGGVVSISDPSGIISKTGSTTDDPTSAFCSEVPDGNYNVSMAVPDGYNATTNTNLLVPVQAGDTGYVEFGAQVSSKVVQDNPHPVVSNPVSSPGNGSSNLVLAAVGGLLLVLGIGLGIYVVVMRR